MCVYTKIRGKGQFHSAITFYLVRNACDKLDSPWKIFRGKKEISVSGEALSL